MIEPQMRSWGPALLLAALLALTPPALAQAGWTVTSLIPEVVSVRMPSDSIRFGIDRSNYPPASFPARYPATLPEGGVMPVQVLANTGSAWSLLLEVPDLRDASGVTLVPAEQVLYRVDGGLWLRASGAPQVIHTGSGATGGWLELELEFAVELTGRERAGAYEVNATLSAIAQGIE